MTREPPLFPPDWADAWGDDVYGLWAEFVVGEVRQRMRWIEPGEFWMGSPEDEPERFPDEGPRHRVRISRGFWLADTTCTQALWSVVGGNSPSHFKGLEECPVENVSFADVRAFLSVLAAMGVSGQPDLPTEAEWEYACRAGSDTPFHFGEQITPQLVNYDGNHPYKGGAKGEYRQRTAAVKALPANRWGLYQMHGNVWEWCCDGPRKYSAVAVVNPEGPRIGSARAVRGGSWMNNARFCRSFSRVAHEPDFRLNRLGFRLVLRS